MCGWGSSDENGGGSGRSGRSGCGAGDLRRVSGSSDGSSRNSDCTVVVPWAARVVPAAAMVVVDVVIVA